MTDVLPLHGSATREPVRAGVKAALLAQAAERGFHVLPGAVLDLDASAPAILAGAEALRSGGRAQAYLAASAVEVDAGALATLAGSSDRLIVRSSTALDGDGRWSGAFASYLDVPPADLAAAVRGCWASAFTRDALGRADSTGLEPGSQRIAVLVQPFVPFAYGGTARHDATDGGVRIAAARGGAHLVVAGERATTVTVAADGGLEGADAGAIPVDLLTTVARLAREVAAAFGVGTIEWGATAEAVLLLQIGPAAAEPGADALGPVASGGHAVPAAAARIAEIVARFRGPLADDLVLPWALAAREVPEVAPIAVPSTDVELRGAVRDVRAAADELVRAAWGREQGTAPTEVIRRLRSGEVEAALDLLVSARPSDAGSAGSVLGLLAGIGRALEERGVLPAAEIVWQLQPEELDRAVEGEAPPSRVGPDRWEAFLAESSLALGTTVAGTAITPGLGAGRLHVVRSLRDIGRPSPRAVLAAEAPLTQLAPLLWRCAGFVASSGNAGAHLFEVAESLGVPAVIGIDLERLGPSGTLVAVDGSAGVVASLARSEDGELRRPA